MNRQEQREVLDRLAELERRVAELEARDPTPIALLTKRPPGRPRKDAQ